MWYILILGINRFLFFNGLKNNDFKRVLVHGYVLIHPTIVVANIQYPDIKLLNHSKIISNDNFRFKGLGCSFNMEINCLNPFKHVC